MPLFFTLVDDLFGPSPFRMSEGFRIFSICVVFNVFPCNLVSCRDLRIFVTIFGTLV